MYKTKSFREKLVCVIVSKIIIFMFVNKLLLVDVFSQLYYLTHAKKQQWWISVKIMKNRFDTAIKFIDFHRFPLSIDKNHSIANDFY